MSFYPEEYNRREPRRSRRRDHSADLAYSHEPAPPYPHSIHMIDNEAPNVAMPSAAAHAYSPPPSDQQDQEYGIVARGGELAVPRSQGRPRSVPPTDVHYRPRSPHSSGQHRRRHRHDSGSDDSDRESDVKSPVDRARHFVNDNFSNSTAGLGVSVLGALVGGLAAREAVELTGKHSSQRHEDPDYKRNQMIGTVVGAAVGALGANAFEKRLEVNRERERKKEQEWDRQRWPRDRVIEKREVIARPRSSGTSQAAERWRARNPIDGRPRSRGRGVEREVDVDVRSWKDVKDWVYDERKSGSLPTQPSDHSDHRS